MQFSLFFLSVYLAPSSVAGCAVCVGHKSIDPHTHTHTLSHRNGRGNAQV